MEFLFEFLGIGERAFKIGDSFVARDSHGCGDRCIGALASVDGIRVIAHLEADGAVFAAVYFAEHVHCLCRFGRCWRTAAFVVAGR